MLAFMLSPTNSICSGDGGTDSGNDGESGLDLLQDEDGNSDESSGYQVNDGATIYRFMAALCLVASRSPFPVDWQG
ncbi:hypothetical protein Tco_0330984 [Tanacetum coccineum]